MYASHSVLPISKGAAAEVRDPRDTGSTPGRKRKGARRRVRWGQAYPRLLTGTRRPRGTTPSGENRALESPQDDITRRSDYDLREDGDRGRQPAGCPSALRRNELAHGRRRGLRSTSCGMMGLTASAGDSPARSLVACRWSKEPESNFESTSAGKPERGRNPRRPVCRGRQRPHSNHNAR
jgi:hypothetical protein